MHKKEAHKQETDTSVLRAPRR